MSIRSLCLFYFSSGTVDLRANMVHVMFVVGNSYMVRVKALNVSLGDSYKVRVKAL